MQKGLKTPQDLSHAARITHATASKLWKDDENVDVLLSTLRQVASALGVEVDELIVKATDNTDNERL